MVRVESVCAGSIAEAQGIVPGDILVAVNGNEIRDVLDYRFYLTDTEITLRMERNKTPYELHFRKGEYDAVGLAFATNACSALWINCRPECERRFISRMTTTAFLFCTGIT